MPIMSSMRAPMQILQMAISGSSTKSMEDTRTNASQNRTAAIYVAGWANASRQRAALECASRAAMLMIAAPAIAQGKEDGTINSNAPSSSANSAGKRDAAKTMFASAQRGRSKK